MTLDSWLTHNGLAEAEFGKRIGRTQAAVNRWRRGLRIPDAPTQEKIKKETKGQVAPPDWHRMALARAAA